MTQWKAIEEDPDINLSLYRRVPTRAHTHTHTHANKSQMHYETTDICDSDELVKRWGVPHRIKIYFKA